MAKETVTRLIDDLDGGEAHETLTFGLDGHSFEIDLSNKNANKLRLAVNPFLEHATPIKEQRSKRGTVRADRTDARVEKEQRQAMRQWARDSGYTIGDKGRISEEIAEAYHAAGGVVVTPAKRSRKVAAEAA